MMELAMPPAGGIALGVDRLVMLLADAAQIDEVVAFPFDHGEGCL
jgi:lysyl-tRNA synthetase class II